MKLVRVLGAALGFCTISSAGWACSCDGDRTVAGEYQYHQRVFDGTVVSKQLVRLSRNTFIPMRTWEDVPAGPVQMPYYAVQLRVGRWFKGRPVDSGAVTVYTPFSGAACGVRFDVGSRYVVFGTTGQDDFLGEKAPDVAAQNACYTNNCTLTGTWDQSLESELLKLQQLQKSRRRARP